MKQSEVFIKAKALIDTPEKWTQGSFARDEKGHPLNYESQNATCFCSLGAIRRVGYDTGKFGCFELVTLGSPEPLYRRLDNLVSILHPEGGFMDIAHFNDSVSYEEVMKVWDAAIMLALQEEESQL